MKITKYEHACFTVEIDGKLLVVDPGAWTTSLGSPENVVGIVVTHEHADHCDTAILDRLIAANPKALVIAHSDVTGQLDDTLPSKSVAAGDAVDCDPFSLKFFGGEHATIHSSIPVISNLGVMINDTLYYPGDSFTHPDRPVNTLALPVAAPWLKISEVIDFVMAIKPQVAFPTHDAILSDTGKSLVDKMITGFAEKNATSYQRIDSSSIEV